jgi:hypothetical protein
MMNPLNWRHYAGIGYYLALLVHRTVRAAQDGRLDDAERAAISGAFLGAVDELLAHVGPLGEP